MKIETYTEEELIAQKNVIKNMEAIILKDSMQIVFFNGMDRRILGKVLDVGITKSGKEYPYYDKETEYYIPAFVVKRIVDN